MLAFASENDIARWKSENRKDILHLIENEMAVWAGDHFVSSRDGRYLHNCPFLGYNGEIHSCAIHETRPKVCADYEPGSSQICPFYAR